MASLQLKEGSIRTIIADAPASGYVFDQWTGDIIYLDDPLASTAIVTMPASDVTITASYSTAPIVDINYGFLYNWYAVVDVRNICSTGWHLPSDSDFDALITYIGGAANGGKLKDIGLTWWDSPNTGSTNEYLFGSVASGYRSSTGIFADLRRVSQYRTSNSYSTDFAGGYQLSYANSNLDNFQSPYQTSKKQGMSARPIKDTTTLTHGEVGTYTDPSGLVYPTICIGTQEWVSINIKTQKYANGDWIDGFNGGTYTPIDNATWAGLTTGALCAYNDDLNNV